MNSHKHQYMHTHTDGCAYLPHPETDTHSQMCVCTYRYLCRWTMYSETITITKTFFMPQFLTFAYSHWDRTIVLGGHDRQSPLASFATFFAHMLKVVYSSKVYGFQIKLKKCCTETGLGSRCTVGYIVLTCCYTEHRYLIYGRNWWKMWNLFELVFFRWRKRHATLFFYGAVDLN